MELIRRMEAAVEEVREQFAPDLRLAVYEIAAERRDGGVALVGFTSESEAAEALHRRAALLDDAVTVQDEVVRLPRLERDGRPHAVLRSATAPLLAEPMVSAPPVSQVVLGQRLLVLREQGRWLQVRCPDGYIGWVHRGYACRMDETEARAWEMGMGGIPVVALGAELAGEDGEVLARLPWGARVVAEGPEARLPDGLRGTLSGEWLPATVLRERFPTDAARVARTAEGWLGSPYLWGGITPAGVDCSGLVQACFRMHGVELPRDSDMQARTGTAVDPGPDFAELRAGDLLFFAEEPGRVSHVAISLGGPRVVHSALGNGGVRRNDLTGAGGLEQELRRLFVTARRVVEGE